jgi:hypothetical protein
LKLSCLTFWRSKAKIQDAIREAVRTSLADCEAIFRAQEANRRMKEKAAHACHSLCRGRVAEEMRRRKGTTAGEHLQFVLGVIDGPRFPKNATATLLGPRLEKESPDDAIRKIVGTRGASSRQKRRTLWRVRPSTIQKPYSPATAIS